MTTEIEDYFYRLSPKNRMLIWLLAIGHTPDDIRVMTVADISELAQTVPSKFCDIIAWCEDRLREHEDTLLFEKQQGIKMPKSYILGLLIKAHERLGVEFTGLQDFVDRIGI